MQDKTTAQRAQKETLGELNPQISRKLLLITYLKGEKAYSCPLCGTRFTYRNGLIKHTKLNRCPKKIFTSEGEKLIKKKSKSSDSIQRHRLERMKGFDSKLEVIIVMKYYSDIKV